MRAVTGRQAARTVGWLARAGVAASLLAIACGGGSGGNGGSVIRFQLTTAAQVSGLSSVRLTAGSVAKTFAIQTLSPTAAVFDVSVPSDLLGMVAVGALARPESGCMGYSGSGFAYIGGTGAVAAVTILMEPADICQGGTAGAGGSGGGGGGAGGAAGGTTGAGGMAGSVAGRGGSAGTGGAGGTAGGAGTGGGVGAGGSVAGSGGRGGGAGTGGGVGAGGSIAGSGGRGGGGAGTGGSAGRGGAAGGGGGASGAGGQASCSAAVGGRPAAVTAPSLTRCTEYSHNDPGAACDSTADTNDPYINDVAVSPDGQYMATAGSSATDGTQDRVKVWRLSGSTPSQCGSVDISNPTNGPAYVAFSPNGQYLAVAWQFDYVYIYSVPSFTMIASIRSSVSLLFGVGFSPDSQTVFTVEWDGMSDGVLYADRTNGTPITSRALGVDPDVLAVSPVAGTGNVTTLAVGGYADNAAVYTFNGTSFTAPTIFPTAASVSAWAIRFSPTGNLLGVAGDDGVVRFWSIPLTSTMPTGSPISLTSGSTIYGLAFSPFGTYLALGNGSQAEIWNVTTRAFVSRTATAAYVDSMTFSASGAALISGEDSCGRVLVCAD